MILGRYNPTVRDVNTGRTFNADRTGAANDRLVNDARRIASGAGATPEEMDAYLDYVATQMSGTSYGDAHRINPNSFARWRQQSGSGGSGRGGNANAQGERDRATRAREEWFRNARGLIDETRMNEADALLLDSLTDRVEGNTLPYDETTVNAFRSDIADRAGAAEAAMAGRVRARPGDPGYEAQMRELMSQRQSQVQRGFRELDQRANIENYDAQTGAMRQLDDVNRGRHGRITDATRYLGGGLREQYAEYDEGETQPTRTRTELGLPIKTNRRQQRQRRRRNQGGGNDDQFQVRMY